MKKRILSGLLAGVLLLLCACGAKAGQTATETAPETTAATAREEAPARIDDKYREWYEVFVWSFSDSDGDGIGDLKGLTEKLDYIRELGCNGIWLMPIMPSPSYHKYDVTDYYGIDPQYGTMEDFRALLAAAHERGIRIILDLPVNHTSDRHPWFLRAAEGPDSPYRDYYVWSDGPADGYTEKNVKVYTDGQESGQLPLRFYDAAPNIPYMGMNEYSQFMRQQTFTVQAEKDGSCVLENWNGAELHCDPEAGVMTVPDWNAFFALPMPLEDRALGLKDTTVHYARITEIHYEGDPEEVRLDFAKYGIALYCDGTDVYLPVSVLSNMMTDIATNYMLYNGENLYAQRVSLDGGGIKGLYDSEMLKAQIQGEARPEDVVRQCYADLCFNFDSFFGHPGKSKLDAAIAEKGLDQALTDLGEDGLKIKNGLLSADLADYISAMNRLFLTVRNRMGSESVPMSETLRWILKAKREGKPSGLGYISDQVPLWQNIHHWVDFLNQDTPVFTGVERIARSQGQAVFYCDVRRVKRGYYQCLIRPITLNPAQMPEFAITDAYFSMLQHTICREPAYWLWSHNRWKRTREEFNRRFEVVNGRVVERVKA